MPLVKPTPSAPPVEQPATVRITPPTYKGITVDSRYVPSSSLLTHVDGSSWTVEYYSQVLDSDNAVQGQGLTTSALYQQYRHIRGFELKVTTALESSQDSESNAMSVTGAANIYPFVIPNVGDVFLADVGDGREGVFQITASTRKTIFKDTCYEVSYELVGYSTEERRADLKAKTVDVLVFVRDFLTSGQNPLIQKDEFAILTELQDRYLSMAARYFRAFISHEFKTLLLPAQAAPVYDAFLMKFVKAVFTTRDAEEVRQLRQLNVDDDASLRAMQILEVLTLKDPLLFKHAAKRMGLMHVRTFTRNPVLEGIRYSGVQYVVYPKDAELSIDEMLYPRTKALSAEVLRNAVSPVATVDVPDLSALPQPTIPLIHAILSDEYYIFSAAFYNKADTGQSQIELLLHDYLDGKALNTTVLLALCQAQHTWGALERFYYTPIVLLLIKAAVRSM